MSFFNCSIYIYITMYIEKGVIILLIFNFFSTLLLQIQFHGAVVAAHYLGVNLGVGDSLVESL